MSSIVRTNMKRFFGKEKKLHLNPTNNRKTTRGRVVQHDLTTGHKITHIS
ncbi:hypothetical protein LCGC14_1510870 [marine sediment metagenome]|uniref:Uncharacterized protein n=1 Tax=marine sediment metagenome TaxID=412755 RepID=A0A0F9JM67_9ZZZZ